MIPAAHRRELHRLSLVLISLSRSCQPLARRLSTVAVKRTRKTPRRGWGWLLACFLGALACDAAAPAKTRRILYNLDGDSCMTLKAGRTGPGPIDVDDLKRIVTELKPPGSQVDTLLVCINAQVLYFPTRVGTLRGTLSTAEERAKWSPHEQQRFRTLEAMYQSGVDPYAVILAEARRQGLEALLTFRMNDDHGNDFLRTRFRQEHAECRLGNGALDFGCESARNYVYRLIEEAVQRYDCDGIELDFQRFPTFFSRGTSDENIPKMNALIERVRTLVRAEGKKRGRELVLGVRVPSDHNGAPTPEQALAPKRACDVATWVRKGWVDFLVVSEFLFASDTLNLPAWRRIAPRIPIYGGIQPEYRASSAGAQSSEFPLGPRGYRQAARQRWADGADGIYLFNFFTSREWPLPTEPPFEVVTQLGDRQRLTQSWRSVATGASAGGYAAFPDIGRAANGDLFCVFYSGYGHVATPNATWPRGGRIQAVRSRDQGRSWSAPEVIVDTDHDDRDPHLAVLRDGSLVCSWFAAVNPAKPLRDHRPLTLFLARSRDDGGTWGAPEEIVVNSTNVYACSAPIRELADGTWILGLYSENEKAGRAFGATIRSTDRGRTWQDLATIGENSDYYLDAETDVIPVKDGSLLAALRSSRTDLYRAVSTNQGRSWSAVTSFGFKGHSPHFLRHSSGVLLLSHRLPNTALHWSLDEGQTWQGPLEIDGVIGAYPGCVELSGGDILCVYYEEGAGSGIRSTRLRIHEDRVVLAPMDD